MGRMRISLVGEPLADDLKLPYDIGNYSLETVESKDRYLVGRSSESDLYIGHYLAFSSVSRRHVFVICKNGSVFLSDAGSKCGTYHNGVRIKEGVEELIKDGDYIGLGKDFVFNVKIEDLDDKPLDEKHKKTRFFNGLTKLFRRN